MLLQHVSCQYLVTSVTSFRSVLVDLSRSRTIHSTEHEPCCPDPVFLSSEECRAVHYGLCSPLLKLPSFSILPSGDLVPSPSIRCSQSSKKLSVRIQSTTSAHSTKYESRKCYNELKSETVKSTQGSELAAAPSSQGNDESIEHLAADLEKHLGNFLTAFMKSENLKITPERKKCSKEKSTQLTEKETFLSSLSKRKPTPLGQDIAGRIEENLAAVASAAVARSTTDLPLQFERNEWNLHSEFSKANKEMKSVVDDIIASLRDVDLHSPPKSSQTDKANHSLKNGFRLHTVEKSSKKSSADTLKDIAPFDQQFSEIYTKSKFSQDLLPSLPHPEFFSFPKQFKRAFHLSDSSLSFQPIKTVTERVLAFEKCPDWSQDRVSLDKARSHQQTSSRKLSLRIHKEKEYVIPSSHSSIKQHQYYHKFPSSSVHIPKFHFPHGRPIATLEADKSLHNIRASFTSLNGRVTKEQLQIISKACGLPLYWKMPLFMAVGGDKLSYITCDRFLNYWQKLTSLCHDDASRFLHILTKGSREYLIEEDFHIMLYDIINTHPGLSFLKDASDFHTRYTTTVIARIFFEVNRSWNGKITIPELRKSNFLQVVSMLEDEEDINQITEYFSYEHFYVIYCKFWNLDSDHDLFISKADLKKHNGGAISTRMIDRIFSGAVKRSSVQVKDKMSYAEFVWFLIAEEDKRHPKSIEYWFRCMDLDGDGYLSMYELEYFYAEQLVTMESLGIETLPFKDCLCQMLDIIRPRNPEKISLSDLKKSKMTPLFFDTFFNFSKYLDHEQKDLFASGKDIEGEQISDWVRYAEEEYQYLVAEESPEQPSKIGITNCSHPSSVTIQELSSTSPDLDTAFTLEDDDYDYAESDPED